jgi:hypothetical protein
MWERLLGLPPRAAPGEKPWQFPLIPASSCSLSGVVASVVIHCSRLASFGTNRWRVSEVLRCWSLTVSGELRKCPQHLSAGQSLSTQLTGRPQDNPGKCRRMPMYCSEVRWRAPRIYTERWSSSGPGRIKFHLTALAKKILNCNFFGFSHLSYHEM